MLVIEVRLSPTCLPRASWVSFAWRRAFRRQNANVFFELGYAWRSHSPVLLAESAADLPFDVAYYRILIYGTPTPASTGSNFGPVWRG